MTGPAAGPFPAHSVLREGTDPRTATCADLIGPQYAADDPAERCENDDRAARALDAIGTYVTACYAGDGSEELQTVLGDLVCDLRHACAAVGLEWADVLAAGESHYAAEIRGVI